MPPEVLVLIAIALLFDFWNGLMDSANVVATVISSRALGPRLSLLLAATANAAGPFIFGTAVARTVGSEVITGNAMTIPVVIAALVGAVLWNIITFTLGIPSSSSHALIGGMVGAVWAGYGFEAVRMDGLTKVLVALFVSPPLGMMAGYFMVRLLRFLASWSSPRVNVTFQRGQILTSIALALAHGTNDAQKTMGIITLGLLAGGVIDRFEVPTWVIAISAGTISLGTMLGGWRVIRTLGHRFYKIRPIHGLGAQAASAGVIIGASLLGGPVSTTQVVSSSIVGAGAAQRARMVRWNVFGNILVAWVLTIPLAGLVGALVYTLLQWLG
ncbi:MAG: inorganic phosphate transporter [Anaerolineae bacterium]|nr:inorganic phosphate transporter [Anaerolineae bacterium]